MPSTDKTQYLGLNKWVGNDKPKRADLVADNEILDQAYGGLIASMPYINVMFPPVPMVGAKGNANYYNASNSKWYEDSLYSVEAADDTSAFRNIFNFVRNSNIKKVKMPKGAYLLNAYRTSTDYSSIPVIPQGVTFEGEGYFTELKVNQASFVADGSYRLFLLESFVTAKNFRINGSKDLINRTGFVATDFIGVLAKDYQTDYSFEDIWVHDIIGVNKESFGVMTYRGSERVTFKNIKGWNNEGTPIHVTGDYLIDKMATDVDVINCITYDNTWQGISIYGAKNVRIYNHQSFGNDGNGVNFEWCEDVDVYDSKSYNNGYSGFGSYGKANFRLHDCNSRENNTRNQNWIGEISLTPSSWFTGSPPPKGTVGIVEINNCKIEPSTGKKHLVYGADNTVNMGTGLPDGITINNSGVENWLITSRDYIGGLKDTASLPNIYFKGFATSQPILLESLPNFTSVSNITSQIYSETGNVNPNAVTLTGINSQFGNIYSKYLLKPNRIYHVTVRYKAESINKWILMSRDSSQTDPSYSIILTGDNSLVGQWKRAEGLFKTGNNEQRLQVQYDGSVLPDTINIDYIVVREILNNDNPNALYDFNQFGANKIVPSSSMPTSGAWTKGDFCYNTNPVVLGSAGNKYTVHGWKRITDGSSNVLNTDWVEMRMLTGQ